VIMAILQEFSIAIPSGLILPSGPGYDNWKDGSDLKLPPNFEFNLITDGTYNQGKKKTITHKDEQIGYNGVATADVVFGIPVWELAVPIADFTYREMLNMIVDWQYDDLSVSGIRTVQLNTPGLSMQGLLKFISGSYPMRFLVHNYYGAGQDGEILNEPIRLAFTQLA